MKTEESTSDSKGFIKNRKILYGSLVSIVIFFIIILFIYSRGRISKNEWDSISVGMEKETVVEYLGNPASKTIDGKEIQDTYHHYIFIPAFSSSDDLEKTFEEIGIDSDRLIELAAYQKTDYYNVEMYTYKLNKGNRRIYFVDDTVFYKY